MKKIDITGKRFGRLIAICESHREGDHYFWIFQCDCGKKTITDKGRVVGGGTNSCGCLRRELNQKRFVTHGMGANGSDTRRKASKFYRTWGSILRRTTNPNQSTYARYGGSGITVCERWKRFENFMDDMYESYTKHVQEFGERQTTIDRIDYTGNYSPENCRWATWSEQNTNKRPCWHLRKRNSLGQFI